MKRKCALQRGFYETKEPISRSEAAALLRTYRLGYVNGVDRMAVYDYGRYQLIESDGYDPWSVFLYTKETL